MGVIILLAVMIGVPILEIAVFIEVGGVIGLWPTLTAVVLTAMAGTALLRHQGLSTLARARASLEEGRFPLAEVFDGLCLLLAGALLLTPGFVTDGAGLMLFVPPVRVSLQRLAARYLAASGRVESWTGGPGAPPGGQDGGSSGGVIIDGDYHEVEPGSDETSNGQRNGSDPPRRIGE